MRCTRACTAGSTSAGTSRRAPCGVEVLRGVVVELVTRRHDLAADRRDRVVVAEHRALDLADALEALLDHDLAGEPERLGHRGVELPGIVGLRDAHRRAERRGLHEDREAEPCDPGRDPFRILLPLGLADRVPRAHRQPGGREQHLLDRLVHADRRAEHAGPHVRHVGELEHALHRAVLAHRAVQDGQHHVDRGTGAVGGDELTAGALSPERDPIARAGPRGHLGHAPRLRRQRRRPRHQVPGSLLRDARPAPRRTAPGRGRRSPSGQRCS